MKEILAVVLSVALLLPPGAPGQDPKASGRGATDASAESPAAIFRGHPAGVTSLAFSPDGRRVVSACPDDVRAWDAGTGREIRVRPHPGGQVVCVFPGGDRAAISWRGNKVMPGRLVVLDLADGEALFDVDPHGDWDRKFPFPPAIGAMAASPDGGRLAIGGSIARVGGPHGSPGGVVAIRDAKTGAVLRRFELPTFAVAVAFGPDGKTLAAGTSGAGGELPESGEVRVWDVERGEATHTFKARPEVVPGGPQGRVVAVAIGPDGKRVAGAPGEVLAWDLATRRLELTLRPVGRSVGAIAFSPDGKWLASGGGDDPLVRLWSTATGREDQSIQAGLAEVRALAFAPDGRRLAVGGRAEGRAGVVQVWAMPGD